MLPRGRPPGPGTAEEKAATRRERVRLNVRAYRERRKHALAATSTSSSAPRPYSSRPAKTASSMEARCTASNGEQVHDEDVDQVIVSPEHHNSNKACRSSSRSEQGGFAILWSTPKCERAFCEGLLAAFRSAMLPSKVHLPVEPQHRSLLVTPCSPWILTACCMAEQKDRCALKSGMLAIAMIINVTGHGKSDLQVASLQMQRQAIGQLRSELEPISSSRQRKSTTMSLTEVYLSCLAVALFEMISAGFSPAFLNHLNALNSLIELIYADPHVNRFQADLITEDFGLLEMTYCLKYGVPSRLRETRLKLGLRHSELGGKGRPNATVYGDIIDNMDELPSLIVRMERIGDQPNLASTGDELRHVTRALIRVEEDLDAWLIQFEHHHGSIMVEELVVNDTTGENESRCDLATYEHGTVGLLAFMFQLYALEASIEAMQKLVQLQQRHNAGAANITGRLDDQSNTWVSGCMTGDRTTGVPCEAKPVVMDSAKSILHDKIKIQRIKARSTMLRLIKISERFWPLAHDLTGQQMLIQPYEKVGEVLEMEKTRLEQDLRYLVVGDHQGAFSVGSDMEEITEIVRAFKALGKSMRRSCADSSHSG